MFLMSIFKLSGISLAFAVIISMIAGIFIGGLIVIINLIFNISISQTYFFLTAFESALVISLILSIAYIIREYILMNKLSEIFKEHGDSREYINELERQIASEKFALKKARLQLLLANNYEQQRDYEKVFETVKSIDVENLTNSMKAKFYSDIVYYYVMTNQLDNAKYVLKLSEKYIEKYYCRGEYASSICNNLGVFEYSQGNLIKAETNFLYAKGYAKSQRDKINADLYLGLIYVNTNRKEYARDIVLDNIKKVRNKRHKEDMTKLINRIEIAFLKSC